MNIEVKKHIQEVLKRSSDFHNVYTPFELCEEMISKLPEVNKNMNIMVMFNLEFLWVLRQKLGREGINNIWFMTPCEMKKKVAIRMGINENQIVNWEYNTKIIYKSMPKFDVVVGNPPYKREIHIEFLNLAFKMSKQYVLWVHPSSWLLDERNLSKSIKTRKLIGEHIVDLTLINGNSIFNVSLFSPCVIDLIDKKINNNGKIKVIDKINNKTIIYDDINHVNKWSDTQIYPNLKNKILAQANLDNLEKHKIVDKSPMKDKFLVNLSYIRGNVDIQTMTGGDFYTFVPKEEIVENQKTKPIYFQFDTEKEATNFLNFLKTDFARFSLAIYKLNQHFKYSMGAVCWLDFLEEWPDIKLYEYFKLTKEEIEFIEKNIPKYYNE